MTTENTQNFATGDRVRLTVDVDRYPHFVAKAGMQGVILDVNPNEWPNTIAVKLDEHLDGAEEWDNTILWSDEEREYFPQQVELVSAETVQEREYKRLYLQASAKHDELLAAVIQWRKSLLAPHRFNRKAAELRLTEIADKTRQR